MRQVCAICRRLGEPTVAEAAGGRQADEELLPPMGAPTGAWCPVWRMWVASPEVTGCTLFEAVQPARDEEAGAPDGAVER